MEQCLSDPRRPSKSLDTSGAAKVSLIGLRFGATLAALTASRRQDIDRIVLWDPVPDGRSYLEDVRDLHDSWLHDRMGTSVTADPARTELLGFPVTETIREQFQAVTLTPFPALRARRVADGVGRADALPDAPVIEEGGMAVTDGVVPRTATGNAWFRALTAAARDGAGDYIGDGVLIVRDVEGMTWILLATGALAWTWLLGPWLWLRTTAVRRMVEPALAATRCLRATASWPPWRRPGEAARAVGGALARIIEAHQPSQG